MERTMKLKYIYMLVQAFRSMQVRLCSFVGSKKNKKGAEEGRDGPTCDLLAKENKRRSPPRARRPHFCPTWFYFYMYYQVHMRENAWDPALHISAPRGFTFTCTILSYQVLEYTCEKLPGIRRYTTTTFSRYAISWHGGFQGGELEPRGWAGASENGWIWTHGAKSDFLRTLLINAPKHLSKIRCARAHARSTYLSPTNAELHRWHNVNEDQINPHNLIHFTLYIVFNRSGLDYIYHLQ
jgi:hypothetical protein